MPRPGAAGARAQGAGGSLETLLFSAFGLSFGAVLIPFGEPERWPVPMAAGVAGCVIVFGWGRFRDGGALGAVLRPVWPAILAFAAAAAWATYQSLPLQLPVPGAPTPPVSLDPEASSWSALRLASYGLAFVASALVCSRAGRAEALVRFLILVAVLETLYALADMAFGLGWEAPGWNAHGRLFADGTFANRNVFATFAGLALMAAVALLHKPVLRAGDLSQGWRIAVVRIAHFALERAAPLLVAVPILVLGLVLTQGRGGVIAACFGLAALIAAMALMRGRATTIASTTAVVACAAVVLAYAGSGLSERFAVAPEHAAERAEIYQGVIAAVAKRPWQGSGLGTAALILPDFIQASVGRAYDRAHNLYLGLALELGIPAAVLLVSSVVWVAFACLARLRKGRLSNHLPALGLAATVLVGVHSLFDDTLESPGLAWMFALLLGAAISRPRRARHASS